MRKRCCERIPCLARPMYMFPFGYCAACSRLPTNASYGRRVHPWGRGLSGSTGASRARAAGGASGGYHGPHRMSVHDGLLSATRPCLIRRSIRSPSTGGMSWPESSTVTKTNTSCFFPLGCTLSVSQETSPWPSPSNSPTGSRWPSPSPVLRGSG